MCLSVTAVASVFPGACAPGLGICGSSARIGTSTRTMGDWRWSGVSASVCRGEGIARRIQEVPSCLRIQKNQFCSVDTATGPLYLSTFLVLFPQLSLRPGALTLPAFSQPHCYSRLYSQSGSPWAVHPPPPQARPHLDGSPHLGHGPLPVLSTPPKTRSLPPGPKAGLFIDSISPRDPGLSNCPLRPRPHSLRPDPTS